MKLEINKKALPTKFGRSSGLLFEANIYLHPHGRLAAKMLVFDSRQHLRKFWRRINPVDVGSKCYGAVNPLAYTAEKIDLKGNGRRRLVVDRRYFCIIGLCKEALNPQCIMHECVHAAYSYERRVKRNLFGKIAEFDEERIAYPAGIIAEQIYRALGRRPDLIHSVQDT